MMPKNRSPQTDRPAGQFAPAPFDIEPVIAMSQRNLRAGLEAQRQMLDRAARLNGEMLEFLDTRLEQDRKAAKELAGCKTMADALEVSAQFFETAFKQYSEEMGKVAGLCADQAKETMEDLRSQVSETIEPVAKSTQDE